MTLNFPMLLSFLITAAIPLLAIYVIRTIDTLKTTRLETLILCVLYGGAIAFGAAYLLNTLVLRLLTESGAGGYQTVVRFTAPILEEILKAIFLLFLIRRPQFRYFVDGAIYGFCVGIGFAVLENFFYISRNPGAGLALAISRSLSTSMMHAMASAIVGISLGRLRRAEGGTSARLLPIIGIVLAIGAHILYNNVVNTNALGATVLLLVAVGLGLGGAGFIGLNIRTGVRGEQESFTETLGGDDSGVDISIAEVRSIQRLGSQSIEEKFDELRSDIGDENTALIRRLLITQANIGILKNNLAAPNISPRLRAAWEKEAAQLEDEFLQIRQDVDQSVQAYMQRQFPTEDESLRSWVIGELAESDPTRLHTFDMFMRSSGLAASFTAEELEQLADKLQRIDLFREIDPADLENLARAIEAKTYADGTLLFDQGDDGDAMYMIDGGAITIYSLGENGRENPIRTFEPGRVVGDFAVLDGQPRSARARATGELHALVLTRYQFQTFIQSRPQVIAAVLKVLAEKARFTTNSVEKSVRAAGQIARGEYALPRTQTATVQTVEDAPNLATASTDASISPMSAPVMRRILGKARLDLAQDSDGDQADSPAHDVRRTETLAAVGSTLSNSTANDSAGRPQNALLEQAHEEVTELTYSVAHSLEHALERLAHTLHHDGHAQVAEQGKNAAIGQAEAN